ncbi:MAG TPA: Smr/MutS family protein, partial [Longimicrobiales bacterium]|nr:Smr/MutS family protein [Longimicrobiales bacterium]
SREARRRVERAVTRQRERSTPRRARRGGRTTISPGDPVLISSTGSRGRVVEVRSDRAWVEAGALRLEVPVRELEILELDEETPRSAPRVGGWRGPHGANARPEVDLRGLRVDEVDQELGRALDDALLGDLSELRIIHGKGTGALRQRVAELLEGDPRVSGFRMGAPNEGGAGVTVASLRT